MLKMNVKEIYTEDNYLGGAKKALNDGLRVELRESPEGVMESHIMIVDNETNEDNSLYAIIGLGLALAGTATVASWAWIKNKKQKYEIEKLQSLLEEKDLMQENSSDIIMKLSEENKSLELRLLYLQNQEKANKTTQNIKEIKNAIKTNKKIISLSERYAQLAQKEQAV